MQKPCGCRKCPLQELEDSHHCWSTEHGDGDEVGKVSGQIIHGLVSGFMKLACILRAMGSHRRGMGSGVGGWELDSALWWWCEDWRPQCARPGLVLGLVLSLPCRLWRCNPSETARLVNAGGHSSQGPASQMACHQATLSRRHQTDMPGLRGADPDSERSGWPAFSPAGAWSGSDFRQDGRDPDYLPVPILGNLRPHMGVCL